MKNFPEEIRKAYEDFSIEAAIRDYNKAIGILNELKRKIEFCFYRKGTIKIKHPDSYEERVENISQSLNMGRKEIAKIIEELNEETEDFIFTFNVKLPGIYQRYLKTGMGNVSSKENSIRSYGVNPDELIGEIEKIKAQLIEVRKELVFKKQLE